MIRTPRSHGRLAFLATLALTGAAGAQPEPSRPPVVDPREFAARSICRVVTAELRSGDEPGPTGYMIASLVLKSAVKFAPRDEGILRHRLEAAWRAGDQATTLEISRQLLRLDPRDTVALLRLVSARIGEMQTAEARLAAFERFLGAEGKSLPPEVRSRLALDAALLLRERGDLEGFAARLAEATSLDSTNKEAAALAARFIDERTTDPVARLEALLNLLYADPLDPNVHLSVSHLLAGEWAFAQANRFHGFATKLFSDARGDLSDQEYIEQLVMTWHAVGPEEVVRLLNLDLGRAKNQAALAIRQAEAEDLPRSGLTDPADVTLAVPYERLRLLAANACGKTADAADASRGLERIVRVEIGRLPAEMPDDEKASQKRGFLLTLATTRFWTGVDVEGAGKVVEELTAEGMLSDPTDPPAAALLALAALRDGRAEEAVRLAEPAADRSAAAGAALAMALEASGERDRATATLRSLVDRNPFAASAAWARHRLGELCGSCADPAAAVASVADGVPRTLDELVRSPHTFMALSVSTPDTRPAPLERVPLHVTLRNTSPFPLAVGADRVLNSRLLFAPAATVGTSAVTGGIPEVIDIDRRLRLLPREELAATAWPDLWSIGVDLENSCTFATTVRWRVLQGFVISPAGVYGPGPMCLATDTPWISRGFLAETGLSIDELAVRLGGEDEAGLVPLVAAARAMLLGPRPGSARPDATAVERLARAVAQHYPSLSPAARAALVAALPHNRLARGMAIFDDALRTEADPDVLAVVLLTRPTEANDPILTAAAASSDPTIARLATLISGRLASTTETYSRRRTLEVETESETPFGARP